MHIFKLFFLFSFVIVHDQCDCKHPPHVFPQVRYLLLDKNKPIQLSTDYNRADLIKLKGTLFPNSFSKLHGIKKLKLTRSQFTAIKKGALCAAPDLVHLEIEFYRGPNTLTHVTKEMFENCQKIHLLKITYIYPEPVYVMDTNIIEDLVNLKNFTLQNYPIDHLTKNFLKISPKSLKYLRLSYIKFKSIDSDVFDDFTNLEVLIISQNKNWTYLPKDLFKNLHNLKELSLRGNNLKDLTWHEFAGVSNVWKLDLAFNSISSFDGGKIAKSFPKLEYILLELNSLPCTQKQAFVQDLRKSLKHYINAIYKVDPGASLYCGDEW